METWRQISECLDSGLMGALKIEGCSARVGTGNADAAQLSDIVEAEKAAGAEAPAQSTAHEGGRMSRRVKFTVIRGGLAAYPMQPPQKDAPRARAAGPRLITVDGRRVHQPASA